VHELSIAVELVGQIIEAAENNQLPRVDEVELETGILRQVVPEIMQTAFREATRETIANEARLIITEIKAKAQCNRCSLVFEPLVDDFSCPECQIADAKVLQGDKIILKSVSCNI
jgi:hydrogenase nickel incorporation protein HypA/HybF